ncbi:hypothetical protein BDFB_012551 [Asbolus verrucosus]|uniref:Uncharacterized protein n=1 Tax=Asbolus verrucosus TaxID=1661398 RepID=A0A482W3D2_ASBVE|nr:hypothetical protein BDFB_012551 [Asbolus verrucosus]
MKNGIFLCKLALKNFGNAAVVRETGSIDNKKSIGRPKKRISEVVEEVLGATPLKSILKLSQQIHLSCGTSRII